MCPTLLRFGMVVFLASFAVFLPGISAQVATVPEYDRNAKPGEPPPVPGSDEPEVLGRGPVHEGFAQPRVEPQPGLVIPKAPPEPVPEQPAEARPEGNNVVWVPGYWGWDEDRKDFLWISGFWRVAPAGRKWVPGYWTKSDRGWQWVTGFWAGANQTEVPYVPDAPPESLDRGPSVPAPGEGYEYVPGYWMYEDTRNYWRPGFWYLPRPGLVWCPPRWCWTPRGYLFVNGYWDYSLESRGILFAPVYFSKPLWNRSGYYFRPSYAVGSQALVASLWVRPRTNSYAFGDYYGAKYGKLGYQPWAVYGPRTRDPLYGYYRWANRNNAGWQRTLATTYQDRVRGDATLPPRDLVAQQRLATRNKSIPATLEMVRPLNRVQSDSLRITKTTQEDRTARLRYAEAVQKASVDRRTQETKTLARGSRPAPLALGNVPAAVARPAESRQLQRVTPGETQKPKTIQTPAPKTNVTPTPRTQQQPTPKVVPAPKSNVQPRTEQQPTPKVAPAPKTNVAPTPRSTPIPTPKANVQPRIEQQPTPRTLPKTNVTPTPRAAPAPQVAPRQVETPRIQQQPAPKTFAAPAPKMNVAPTPRIQQQPTPRSAPVQVAPKQAPAPAPRSTPPPAPRQAPGPRMSASPPPQRMAPAPQTRSAPRPAMQPQQRGNDRRR